LLPLSDRARCAASKAAASRRTPKSHQFHFEWMRLTPFASPVSVRCNLECGSLLPLSDRARGAASRAAASRRTPKNHRFHFEWMRLTPFASPVSVRCNLECGSLLPLSDRARGAASKAAASRRTPKNHRFLLERMRSHNLPVLLPFAARPGRIGRRGGGVDGSINDARLRQFSQDAGFFLP